VQGHSLREQTVIMHTSTGCPINQPIALRFDSIGIKEMEGQTNDFNRW